MSPSVSPTAIASQKPSPSPTATDHALPSAPPTLAASPSEIVMPGAGENPVPSEPPVPPQDILALDFADGNTAPLEVLTVRKAGQTVALTVQITAAGIYAGNYRTLCFDEDDQEIEMMAEEPVLDANGAAVAGTVTKRAVVKAAVGAHSYTVQLFSGEQMVSARRFVVICLPKKLPALEIGQECEADKIIKNAAKLLQEEEVGSWLEISFQKGSHYRLLRERKRAVPNQPGTVKFKIAVTAKSAIGGVENTTTAVMKVTAKVKRPKLKITLANQRKTLRVKYKNVQYADKVYVQMYFGRKRGFEDVNKIIRIRPANKKGGVYRRRVKLQRITYRVKVKYKNAKTQYSKTVTK